MRPFAIPLNLLGIAAAWKNECDYFDPKIDGIVSINTTYYTPEAHLDYLGGLTSDLPAFCRMSLD